MVERFVNVDELILFVETFSVFDNHTNSSALLMSMFEIKTGVATNIFLFFYSGYGWLCKREPVY